jgi:ribosomal-protein-alanine N-acetyltransferase
MPGQPHPYRLEPARAGDAALLAAMSETLIEQGLRPAWSATRIRWHVRDPDSVVLTARLAATIAGFAVMRYGDDVAHLNLLAVAPAHRRRGVARALLQWLEETALTAGTFIIGLELREGNAAARGFYRALEYRELGQIPGYYQGVESAIRMARDVRARRASTPGAHQQAP